jgi:hypothetical protein
MLMPLKETAVAPLFWSVTVCGADENPTAVFAKLTLDGLACNAKVVEDDVRLTVKSAGQADNVGSNGAPIAGARPKMTETFAVGLFAIFSPAPITSTGGVPPLGVAAANKVPQTDPSPATPPAEFTQVDRIFASVLRVATGTIVPAGTFNPGAVPVVVFTYSDASVNALASAAVSVVPDPMLLYELINGASDHTAATVVSSLIWINVEAVRLPQGPSTAISAIAVLFVPGLSPGFGLPPFAVMYTSVDADGQVYAPVMSKFPFASLVTGCVSSAVAAEPSPVVPTAYSCSVAPLTGC